MKLVLFRIFVLVSGALVLFAQTESLAARGGGGRGGGGRGAGSSSRWGAIAQGKARTGKRVPQCCGQNWRRQLPGRAQGVRGSQLGTVAGATSRPFHRENPGGGALAN